MAQVTKELAMGATKNGNGTNKNGTKKESHQANKPLPKTAPVAKAETKVLPKQGKQGEKPGYEKRVEELERELEKAEKLNVEMKLKLQPKEKTFQEMQDEIESIVNNGKLLEKLVVKKENFKRRLFEVKEFVFGTGIGNGSLLLQDANNKDLHTTEARFLKAAHQAILKEATAMLGEIEGEIKCFMQKLGTA